MSATTRSQGQESKVATTPKTNSTRSLHVNDHNYSHNLTVRPAPLEDTPRYVKPNVLDQNDATAGAADDRESSGDSDSSEDFRDEVVLIMNENKIGLEETGRSDYLPDRERIRLVNSTNICRALGPLANEDVKAITAELSKTLIAVVLSIHDQKKRLEAMNAFLHHGFKDAHLPVKENFDECQYSSRVPKLRKCRLACTNTSSRICSGIHGEHLDCFHHKVWSAGNYSSFFEAQWKLIPQKFSFKQFKYPAIESKRLLPFLPPESTEAGGVGNFAVVQPARMLKTYQDVLDEVCAVLT